MTAFESRAAHLSSLTQIALERERIGFWMHFSAYVLVNAFVIALNALYSPWAIWFIFVLIPWSVGIVAHFLGAFYVAPLRAREKELRSAAPPGQPPSTG